MSIAGMNTRYVIATLLIVLSIALSCWTDTRALSRTYLDLTLSDGVKSSVAVYAPPSKPVGAALLLHGFSGTKENLALVASSLARAGYVVFTPDWRGHGGTGGTLDGQTTTILDDVRVYSDTLRSTYNLSFSLIGGHSMGGGFSQVAASELHPRFLVLMCSGSTPSVLGPLLARGTETLMIAASLDTIVRPESILASASQTANVSVAPGTTYSFSGGGNIRVKVIDNYDHLLVLYSEPLSKEVLSFVGSDTNPPFFEVIATKIVAAVLFVIGMIITIPPPRKVSSLAEPQQLPTAGTQLRIAAMYCCAGLLLPVGSALTSFIPGVGTSSFFVGFFLSIAATMVAATKLRLVRVRVRTPLLDPKSMGLGAALGLLYAVGLHLIVGSDLIRLLPSAYASVAVMVTAPVAAGFALLEMCALDAIGKRAPRWAVGLGTKALSLVFSLVTILLTFNSMVGFFFIFAYSALVLLLPLYIAESRLVRHSDAGRSASLAMFVVVLSLLAAASGARI